MYTAQVTTLAATILTLLNTTSVAAIASNNTLEAPTPQAGTAMWLLRTFDQVGCQDNVVYQFGANTPKPCTPAYGSSFVFSGHADPRTGIYFELSSFRSDGCADGQGSQHDTTTECVNETIES